MSSTATDPQCVDVQMTGALLARNSRLGQLHAACVAEFVAQPTDRDRTPHVHLGRDRARYERMHNTSFVFACEELRVHSDYICIDLGDDAHLTLVFQRGIGSAPRRVDTEQRLRRVWAAWCQA